MSASDTRDGSSQPLRYGKLAQQCLKVNLPLQVLQSAAGYYLGTRDDDGPCSRESVEYWPDRAQAEAALNNGCWTQKPEP